MAELRRPSRARRDRNVSERVARIASAQWGVIGAGQLRDCGLDKHAVGRCRAAGRLHVLEAGLYAVGHTSVPIEGRLTAALIHAGPGAALSHATAAWWWELITVPPARIEVSTPNRAGSTAAILVHRPRTLEPVRHRRLPVTPPAATLLDFAGGAGDGEVRQALSEADYRGLLDLDALHAELRRGRTGSARLRRALERHEPRLARTRSRLERFFLELCERYGLPLPEINARVGRMTVDALWPRQRLVVELDGHRGHRSRAQIDRDRRRELHLRTAGYPTIRYTEDQVVKEPALVAADLLAALE